jgi:predicted RNA-binding protein YlqC (UPF0109 family)
MPPEPDVLEAMLATLARGLVDHPEDVRVERSEEDGTTFLALYVAESDLGQVIGRGGRVARALRTVLRAGAAAQGRRAVLEIVD